MLSKTEGGAELIAAVGGALFYMRVRYREFRPMSAEIGFGRDNEMFLRRMLVFCAEVSSQELLVFSFPRIFLFKNDR